MPLPSTILSRHLTSLAAVALVGAALVSVPATTAGATTSRPVSRATAARPSQGAPRPVPAATARRIAASSRADQSALARARSTGKPVVVASKTTETSQTIARPDGSFVATTHVLPVRVKVHGVWRPVSAALRRVPGGWAPAALPSGVLLSPGGAGPLAVLTSVAGARLAIRFPARLPAPAVSGPTAVYRSALRGVNLEVTATDPGGISLTIVVRSARAAASPLLHRLRLALAAAHLFAHAAGSGTAFTDPAGVTEYSEPPATMWDSRHRRSARAGREYSTAEVPGVGARSAAVRTDLTRDGITFAPNPALLTANTRYPVFITAAVTARQLTVSRARVSRGQMAADGTFNPTVESTQQYFGEVENGNCAGTSNMQGSSWQGVGYQDYQWDCNGTQMSLYRAIYRFDVSNLDPLMVMEKATLEAWVRFGGDHTCTDTWPIVAHWVTNIGSGTTWNSLTNHANDPALEQDVHPGPNPNSTCTAIPSPTWDITDQVATAASGSYTNMSWSFHGDETTCNGPYPCTNNYGWLGLGDNPDIQTVYDRVPPVPDYPGCKSAGECSSTCNSSTNCAESPSPTDNPSGNASAYDDGCGSNGGWINQQTGVNLQVDIAPAISGEDVQAHFTGVDNKNNGSALTIGPTSNGYSYPYTGGGQTTTAIDDTLKDGHSYTWQVQALVNGDGTDVSSGYNNGNKSNLSAFTSPACTFKVDLTPPGQPGVTSTAFPPTNGTTTNGHSGTFTFSSTDPVPSGCNPSPCLASGVYGYLYSLNSQSLTFTTGNSANLTIGDWGMNILAVEAEDNAGNWSNVNYYTFYVPWNSGLLPHPGDVDGDGLPDLLATTTVGSTSGLNLYSDPTAILNGLPTPSDATNPGSSPDKADDWSAFSITHRGSVTQQGSYDDVWALGGSHHTLYLYQNNPASHGAQPQFGSDSFNTVTYPSCGGCSGYPTDWSSYTQILSPGDAWAGDPLVTNPNSQCNTSDSNCDFAVPSLFAIDSNGALWAFQGQFGNALANPVKLASSGWGGMTLIAPGQVQGQLELWARNITSGALNYYTITLDGNGLPSLSGPTQIPGITVTKNAYPAIASAGDNSTGGPPNLYAVDSSGNVWAWRGVSGNVGSNTNPPSPLSSIRIQIGTIPSGTVINQLS